MDSLVIFRPHMDLQHQVEARLEAAREETTAARRTLKSVTEQLLARLAASEEETAVARVTAKNLTTQMEAQDAESQREAEAARAELFTTELCSVGAIFLCSTLLDFLNQGFNTLSLAYITICFLAAGGCIDIMARIVASQEETTAARMGDETICVCALATLGLCLVLPCSYFFGYSNRLIFYLAMRGCVGTVVGRIAWQRVVTVVSSWPDQVYACYENIVREQNTGGRHRPRATDGARRRRHMD